MHITAISLMNRGINNRISNVNKNHTRNLYSTNFDYVSFQGLLPKNAKIKIAFFDIDETLKHWDDKMSEEVSQTFRNKVFQHTKDNGIQIAYSSDRGFDRIMPLIEDGSLAMPDWIVGNNGGAIFKNVNGKMEEIKTWSENLAENFKKDQVRSLMAKIANEPENMFSKEEWAKVPPEIIPEGQKEFRGSKITEYVGNESPINIRFAIAPGVYEKNIQRIEQELKDSGINANLTFFHYAPNQVNYDGLRKYFGHQAALDVSNHYLPRLYPDGTGDTLLICATDKGVASEYIRKELGLKSDEVFAAGDGENDFGHTKHGYYFALISNAVTGLRNKIKQNNSTNIIEATKPGAEGILEVLV